MPDTEFVVTPALPRLEARTRMMLVTCTNKKLRAASSVVEHLTFNQGVPGSIPGRPTSLYSDIRALSAMASAGRYR